MKTVVYQSLRDEMTAWFTAMHNYEIGQYGIVAVLFTLLLKTKSITFLTFGAIAIIGVILVVGIIYRDVQNKATRIGSYLLVAYEIPERNKHKKPKIDEEFQHWILANRSSSSQGLGGEPGDNFGFNKEESRFYDRQFIAVLVFCVLTGIMITRVSIETHQDYRFDIVAIGLFFLATIYFIIVNRKDKKASKTYEKKQVQIWKDYWANKPENDTRFLREIYGIGMN